MVYGLTITKKTDMVNGLHIMIMDTKRKKETTKMDGRMVYGLSGMKMVRRRLNVGITGRL